MAKLSCERALVLYTSTGADIVTTSYVAEIHSAHKFCPSFSSLATKDIERRTRWVRFLHGE